MLQRLSRRRVAGLTADIDLLEQRLVEIVTADAALAHRFRLLTSMPGGRRRVGFGICGVVEGNSQQNFGKVE
jgi:hypothetical protein